MIVGARGFIGQHLTQFIRGNTIWELVNYDENNDPKNYRDLDLVVNLAACADPKKAKDFPGAVMHNNWDIISDIMDMDWKRMIHISTAEVYGPYAKGAPDVNACLKPTNEYAVGKALQEDAVRTLAGDREVSILNIMNVFGKFQPSNKLFPTALRNLKDGTNIPVVPSTRRFVHADEVSNGILAIAKTPFLEPKYHLCGGREMSIEDFVKMVHSYTDYPKPDFYELAGARPGQAERYALEFKMPGNYVARKTLAGYVEQTVRELS